MFRSLLFIMVVLFSRGVAAQKIKVNLVKVDSGWAKTSVNSPVFRKNSVVSFDGWQYIAFYNQDGYVVLGKRKLNDAGWRLKQTGLKGNVADAHNSISIIVDDSAYLHMAWDHHNSPLHYVRSKEPGSLELTNETPMTGKQENKVTYPEFYRLPGGHLIFLYRDGGSGNGSLVMNRYDLKTKTWTQLHSNLIDGEGKRNAYWQACVDSKGGIHLSWVWRETPDVASNHDLCYAFSKDGGNTWQKSTSETYKLPITASSAEYAFYIPQKSELINQTSMFADDDGNPYIAAYWREEGTSIPQYHVVYKKNGWMMEVMDFRRTAFSLNGMGSKNIPVSRPQILVWKNKDKMQMALIFRDEERGGKVSMAVNKNSGSNKWTIIDLTTTSVGAWEPTYDTELWKERALLHLFVQKVEQVDAEGVGSTPAQMVYLLECDPKKTFKK